MSVLKIGEVAKRSDVGIETIRYYERQGLLAEPDRRPSGYRQYDESVYAPIAVYPTCQRAWIHTL